MARYFDVSVDGCIARRAAWTYEDPTSPFSALDGFLAFYAEKMEACFVDGLRIDAQQGDFYGGWVTPNLTGQTKGAAGTEHW